MSNISNNPAEKQSVAPINESPEHEISILSLLIWETEQRAAILNKLRPELFADVERRDVYKAMATLHKQRPEFQAIDVEDFIRRNHTDGYQLDAFAEARKASAFADEQQAAAWIATLEDYAEQRSIGGHLNPNAAEKFKKPQFKRHYTPEDAYNALFRVKDFVPQPKTTGTNPYEAKGNDVYFSGAVMFAYNEDKNEYVYHEHPKVAGGMFGLTQGERVKPHQLLHVVKFNSDYNKTRQYILNEYLNKESEYIRVGVKYFKEIKKENNFGIPLWDIVVWNRETIVDDFGKGELKRVRRYDDFTVHPDNISKQASVNGLYNLYKRFPHTPANEPVNITDIPAISGLMAHVFGEQQELGYQYLKVLYEQPKQILPVLCMVSEKRGTGKTTFMNFLQMIFGGNADIVPSASFADRFNSSYAYLNIIGVDEAVIEKAQAVEKIKMLATAKTLMVNMKSVPEFSVPFYGKIVMATNKERDFMRIDNEEIRFWIRKLEPIKSEIPDFDKRLRAEIPKFLRYLADLPAVEVKSRMVFTATQISNDQLDAVKAESKSGLHKDMELRIAAVFDRNAGINEFSASPLDIKHHWYGHDKYEAAYIRKVLKDEMKLKAPERPFHYLPFEDRRLYAATGRAYTFRRDMFAGVPNSPEQAYDELEY